ncbi:MAG: signal recognition particle-docking protein FtsY [Clostridiales bacterium]|nr:signal recognition particle-docking protein FtsY [Clostridiales bacterium]
MGIFKKKKETDNRSVSEVVFSEALKPATEKKDEPQSKGFFAKLKTSLSKTGGGLLSSVFKTHERIDDDFYDELEEAMILADMGMDTAAEVLSSLRKVVKEQKLTLPTEAREALVHLLAEKMEPQSEFQVTDNQAVILIVGVNGVGKTTSIGKLANYYKLSGKSVLLAAADTFRAAAAEQLTVWSTRADVPIIKHGEGADPAAVVFDAIASFKAKKHNLLICDTAGRLHNKKNLMDELAKIRRVISRELPDVPVEVLLVLDATTGQNAVLQAQAFSESSGLTGLIITKLDGTAKGGIAVSIKDMLNLPIRFIGVGEGIDDMRPFNADDFAKALLDEK